MVDTKSSVSFLRVNLSSLGAGPQERNDLGNYRESLGVVRKLN